MSGGKRVENTPAGQRAARGGVKPGAVIAVVVGVLLAAYVGLCVWVQNNGKTMPDVRFADIYLNGDSREQVEADLTDFLRPEAMRYHVNVVCEDFDEKIGMDVAAIDVAANVERVMSAGKENFVLSGFNFLRYTIGGNGLNVDVVPESVSVTEEGMEKINAMLDRADEHLAFPAEDDALYRLDLEQGKMSMTKGYTSRRVDREDAMEQIREALVLAVDRVSLVDLQVKEQPPITPDFNAIYTELYSEVVEPAYDKETGTVSEHVVGVDFNVDALKAAYEQAAEGETFSIPITVTQPKDTKEAYEKKLFADVLGSATSKVGGTANRKTNVKLSAAACDGVILLPGEIFAYNETTGSRSADKGYLPAPTYNAGASVDDVGGGICQTSSTIYYALLHTTLEVVERQNHSYATGYVPDGMDATVFYGVLDFRFKNNTNYPVKVVTESYDKGGNRYLKVSLVGTNEDGRYAKPTNTVFEVVEPTTSYLADSTVPQGTLVLDKQQNAYRGRKAQVTRTIYEADGTVVEQQDMGVSRYKMRPHLYHYNPLDGDPATWPNGMPPQPVPVAPVEPAVPEVPVTPVVPETPVEPVTPVEPQPDPAVAPAQ